MSASFLVKAPLPEITPESCMGNDPGVATMNSELALIVTGFVTPVPRLRFAADSNCAVDAGAVVMVTAPVPNAVGV